MKKYLLRILLGVLVFAVISAGIVAMIKLKSPGRSSDKEHLKMFKEAITAIKMKYVETADSKKLMQSAINGMLTSLDPHSAYMPAESYTEMKVQMSGSFGGIGIEISIKENKLTVISPIEDTPAYRAGIKSNDHIWKIDDKLTRGLSITEAVSRMRGKKGTNVTLTILREGSPKPLVFPLTRDIIKTKSLRSRTIEPGIGYIRIAHFQETTGPEFTLALKKLHDDNKGQINGLVIDLRNNPGGLLNTVVDVADHFIGEGFNNGLVVYTKGRNPTSEMQLTTKIGEKEPHYPIVVLINGGSASASEILAGAMQDHKRAIIMGTQSFGKGSVQSIIPMRDNAGLKLTTARYYTPSGRSIQAKGITPDIIVNQIRFSDIKKIADNHVKEDDLDGKLTPTDTKPPIPAKAIDKVLQKPISSSKRISTDEASKSDYQLSRAVELLRGLRIIGKTSSTKN